MAFALTNVSVTCTGGVTPPEDELLTGATGSTIVKSLEIITGSSACSVNIIRKNANGVTYADIKVDLKQNDYLVLWEGFFVIPYNHKIYVKSTSNQCVVVANVVHNNIS